MNKPAVLLALALSPFAVGAQAPEPAAPAEPRAQMQPMQGQMRAMHETMARIQAEQDPAQRQRLMQEHMQSMHAGMATMGQTMRGSQADPPLAQCGDGDMQCRMQQMQMQHGAMAERMGMMQQMMSQMMEHMMRHESPQSAAPDSGSALPPAAENHEQHH
jgi:hypothetical protein